MALRNPGTGVDIRIAGIPFGGVSTYTVTEDSTPATLDLGSETHSGLYSPGHIRIKP